MIKVILGILLVASPFIALALLPLYTDRQWAEVGIAFGITFGIVIVIVGGLALIASSK